MLHIDTIEDRAFRGLRQLNTDEGRAEAGKRHRLAREWMRLFPGDGPYERLAGALAARKAIDMKEFTESVEFFERVRKRVRAPVVADLCCGHGLTGLLFAALERRVERVVLVDRRRPRSYANIFAAVCAVAPWVADKVTYFEGRLRDAELPPGATVLGVHACGVRTDRCLDHALALGGAVALMPCCYGPPPKGTPPALAEALGPALAADVHRTYRLEQAGYRVDWTAIPRAITPMNRVMVGTRSRP